MLITILSRRRIFASLYQTLTMLDNMEGLLLFNGLMKWFWFSYSTFVCVKTKSNIVLSVGFNSCKEQNKMQTFRCFFFCFFLSDIIMLFRHPRYEHEFYSFLIAGFYMNEFCFKRAYSVYDNVFERLFTTRLMGSCPQILRLTSGLNVPW